VESAVAIIEELSVAFDPESYHDEHRAHLLRVIESKQQGKKIPAQVKSKEPVASAPDLMGALEQSLARIRGEKAKQKGRKPRSTPSPRRSDSTAKQP
jgi:DNA end-binding protein Ku